MRLAVTTGCAVAVLLAAVAAQEQRQIYRRGDGGIVLPKLVTETKPRYTPEALKARIQGAVLMEAVVEPNGRVGAVDVIKSLDTRHGLDAEAVKALKQWTFKPGTKDGKPVPVRVEIEMTFTLRAKQGDPQPLK